MDRKHSSEFKLHRDVDKRPKMPPAFSLNQFLELVPLFSEILSHLLINEKGDVGMAKHFSKKYGNKG